MPATQAAIGYLATLSIGSNASPIVYAQIAEIKVITPNLATVPAIDATHLQSPNATEEMLPGLVKPGTLDFSGNFTGDTSQLSILSDMTSRTVYPFQVTWKTAAGVKTATLTGQGFFTKFDISAIEPSKLVEFAAAIQITGSENLSAA